VRSRLADEMTARIRADAITRLGIAERMLEGFSFQATPGGFHIWLQLPEPWRAQDLVAAARDRGVSMTSTELFVPGRAETPHALRVSICATRTHAELERGLTALVELLRQAPEPCLAVA